MSAAWFVDGAYFGRCWEVVSNLSVDWNRFQDEIENDAGEELIASYYFDATDDTTAAEHNSFYKFLQLPRPNGPAMRLMLGSTQERELKWPSWLGGGPVLHPGSGDAYVQRVQKEVDVLLAFNLVRSQLKEGWRKLYLVAGDKDFFQVVRHLVENEGVQLKLFGLRSNRQGLPTIASKFGPFGKHIYFEDIVEKIERQGMANAHAQG